MRSVRSNLQPVVCKPPWRTSPVSAAATLYFKFAAADSIGVPLKNQTMTTARMKRHFGCASSNSRQRRAAFPRRTRLTAVASTTVTDLRSTRLGNPPESVERKPSLLPTTIADGSFVACSRSEWSLETKSFFNSFVSSHSKLLRLTRYHPDARRVPTALPETPQSLPRRSRIFGETLSTQATLPFHSI